MFSSEFWIGREEISEIEEDTQINGQYINNLLATRFL